MKSQFVSHSEEKTKEIAHHVLRDYSKPNNPHAVVFELYGNLGTGKTVFVKAIGEALGIDDIVSPSFVIYFEYPIEIHGYNYLYHFDLYRITEDEEFDHLGVDKVLQPGNVICIEWSENSGPIRQLLRERADVVEIHLDHVDEYSRRIEVKPIMLKQ